MDLLVMVLYGAFIADEEPDFPQELVKIKTDYWLHVDPMDRTINQSEI